MTSELLLKSGPSVASSRRFAWTEDTLGWALLVAMMLAVSWLPLPTFVVGQGSYVGIAALVGIGLVLLTGIAGMTSFGQAALMGVAAYTSGLIALQTPASPLIGLACALVVTCASAAVLGLLTLRLSGHFLPLGTLAWALAISYGSSSSELLGKFDGLSGLPALSVLGLAFGSSRAMFLVIWACVVLALVLSFNLLRSRTGRAIRSLKDAEVMAESCGIPTARYRLTVFVYAAGLAAVAGWLYAFLQRSVNPTPFSLGAGIEFLFMAVLGGVGSLWGALVGAMLFAIAKDQLQRWLPELVGVSGSFDAVAFGLLVLFLLQKAPAGLWPLLTRRFPSVPSRPVPTTRVVAASDAAPMPPRGTLLLRARELQKRFGGLVAVNGVSLDVRAGEVVALIGPNGAGKSTTFNLLTGVLEPTAGQVELLVDGEPQSLLGRPARDIAKLGVARTFQHARLIGDATVLDNVMLGAHLRGRSTLLGSLLRLNRAEEALLRSEALRQLERVGLAEYASRRAETLALGQQRVVEIARALCANPTLLLLDEPAAGLRHLEKAALARLVKQLQEEGVSVLFVEHDMDFVMGLADRIYVMEFGQPIAEGTPEEIVRNPAVLNAYLGSVEEEVGHD